MHIMHIMHHVFRSINGLSRNNKYHYVLRVFVRARASACYTEPSLWPQTRLGSPLPSRHSIVYR